MISSDSSYILVINGKPEGPFSIDELREKPLRPGDFVKTPDMVDYKEAHEIAELCQLFGFKRRIAEPQYFAGLDQRLLASALDWVFVGGIYFITGLIAVLIIKDPGVRLTIGLGLIPLILLTKLTYHVIMESSEKQATYGKQILKIKVCDMEGARAGLGRIFGRNLSKLLSSIFFIGYFVSFFNRKQQCLHDMIAGTLVVKERLF